MMSHCIVRQIKVDFLLIKKNNESQILFWLLLLWNIFQYLLLLLFCCCCCFTYFLIFTCDLFLFYWHCMILNCLFLLLVLYPRKTNDHCGSQYLSNDYRTTWIMCAVQNTVLLFLNFFFFTSGWAKGATCLKVSVHRRHSAPLPVYTDNKAPGVNTMHESMCLTFKYIAYLTRAKIAWINLSVYYSRM